MIRYNRTIEEKLNYIKICDLVIENSKEMYNEYEEELNNIDKRFKETEKKKIEKTIKVYKDMEKEYHNTKNKLIRDLKMDEEFKEYIEKLF